MISIGATPLIYLTPGTAPIALSLQCVGTECCLTDCTRVACLLFDCDQSRYIGVKCISTHPGPGVSKLL